MNVPPDTYRLSQAASAGGCAAKIGPGDLRTMLAAITAGGAGGNAGGLGGVLRFAEPGTRVLVGPETLDDAGVMLFRGQALIATTDFIPPVCDDPRRFGRIAATNALSDVYAMGGQPLFALNLCCFPADAPVEVLAGILAGSAAACSEAGAAVLGGHSIRDQELKFGLAVVGYGDPNRLFTNRGACPGDRLILTKPLGSGALVNAFKFERIDAASLEPALVEMERSNAEGSRLALLHGATAATDVTGFGLAGHAWNIARNSNVALEIDFSALPVHPRFFEITEAGVTTGATSANRKHLAPHVEWLRNFSAVERALVFDPQTSGGLLISVPEASVDLILTALTASGHRAAEIGEAVAGEPEIRLL
ncbi:MAG: selenide, water dikinase SelD [Thermoanaerobaculia bacterium]